MQNMVRAVVRKGRIELLEELDIPEGTEVVVTPVNGEDFWLGSSQASLDAIWDNSEDDIYAKLLEV
ncbi:MAG: antitoxin family protein [Pyrinomonadaceae bacterium]